MHLTWKLEQRYIVDPTLLTGVVCGTYIWADIVAIGLHIAEMASENSQILRYDRNFDAWPRYQESRT